MSEKEFFEFSMAPKNLPRANGQPSEMGEERLERLRSILRYQLDLELLLRIQEKKLLEMEIARGERIKEVVELALINDYLYRQISLSISPLASPIPSLHSPLAESASAVNELERIAAMGIRSSSPLATAARPPPFSEHQFEMRPDGSVVMLRCPKCFADKFKSPLGFVNHCRIHCHVIFSSPEDRQTRGAVPVDPSMVPMEIFGTKHPSQIRQEQELAYIRSEIQTSQMDTSRLPMIQEHTSDYAVISINDPYGRKPKRLKAAQVDDLTFDDEDGTKPASLEAPHAAVEARQAIQKSVIIGNEATCLIASNSLTPEMKGRVATHKWKIYVRPGDFYQRRKRSEGEDYYAWLRGVRFILHDSYEPSVVEVPGPIMELELEGYGEFPVRVQLLFWDDAHNKPIEFVHHVRIFMATKQNRSTPGPERLYTFELDKDTDMAARLNHPAMDVDYTPPAVTLKFTPLVTTNADMLRDAYNRTKPSSAELLFANVMQANPQFPLPFSQVEVWFKQHTSKTAPAGAITAKEKIDLASLKYCRYCGLAHEPQERFATLQKNCAHKPRRIKLSTKTSSAPLLTKYPVEVEGNVSRKDFVVYRWSWLRQRRLTSQPGEDSAVDLVRSFIDLAPIDDKSLQEEDIVEAERSEAVLAGATKSFLSSLLSLSMARLGSTAPKPGNAPVDPTGTPQCLTPWHVYSCLAELPEGHELDFLNNSHLSL